MHVRVATSADRAAAIACWEACGLTRAYNPPDVDFDRAVGGPASAVLVGEMDGAVVATAMVGNDGHRGWIYYVAVLPVFQRRGLGREMVRAAEAWLAAGGVVKAQLLVRESNAAVIGFYEALGYEVAPVKMLGRWL